MRITTGLKRASALVFCTAVLAAPALGASDKSGTNRADEKGSGGPVAQLDLAHELYAYSKQQEDVVAAIAAARIAAAVPTKEVDRKASNEQIDGEAAGEAAPGDDVVDLERMIAHARQLAADDQRLQAMIDEVEATKTKGNVSGVPIRYVTTISGRTRTTFKPIRFKGREIAEIAINGGNDTDLDLYVHDQNGNRICSSTRSSDVEYCRFYPRWTGPFTIRVVNHSRYSNRYVLVTN